jgi:3-dehydroquinate dehydratase type I
MICISIGLPTVERCEALLKDPDIRLAEIRLDGARLSIEDIRTIFTLPPQLIATCRPGSGLNEKERKKILLTAVEAGAAFVDIELESGGVFKEEILQAAGEQECRVIISYHNFEYTPAQSGLEAILRQCFADGADIAKIACRVHSESDSARILSLYAYEDRNLSRNKGENGQIVALGMGEKGIITRIAAPLLGAPFTYAAQSTGMETAPGQLDRKTLEEVYRLLGTTKGTMHTKETKENRLR